MTARALLQSSAPHPVGEDGFQQDKDSWMALLHKARIAMKEGREVTVSPDSIRRMENQPRKFFSQDSLQRLADSLRVVGQIQPGLIRRVEAVGKVKYELMDGERRWRSAQLAGLNYRATLVNVDDENVPFLIAAVANFNREGHTPTEVSDSIEAMRKLKIPMEEIARMLGISSFWALQMHGLQKLHPHVREMLDPELPKDQRLPVSAAVQISKIDPVHQVSLALRVIRSDVTLKGLRDEAVRISRDSGTYVRTHKREPRKQWESARALAIQLMRSAKDLEHQLKSDGMDIILNSKPQDQVAQLREDAEKARRITDDCINLLRNVFSQ